MLLHPSVQAVLGLADVYFFAISAIDLVDNTTSTFRINRVFRKAKDRTQSIKSLVISKNIIPP